MLFSTASRGTGPTEPLPSETVPEEGQTEPTEADETKTIVISSLAELAQIGVSEDFPLDGTYELACDIYGGTLEPIGTENAPFTGVFDGSGHIIAGIAISGENAGFFGSLSGQVFDLTLTDISVSGSTSAGILAGRMNGATVRNVLVTGTVSGDGSNGAVAGGVANSYLEKVVYFTGTNLPAAGNNGNTGALMLRSQPPYIAIVMTQTAQLAPDGNIGHFTFSHFTGNGGFALSEDGTVLTPEHTGKFTLTAVYTCNVAGNTVELKVDIPVIVGEDVTALEELSTIDGVFYEQLEDHEVVQISAMEPLQLLEGVFATTIINEEQTVVEEEEAIINLISTWEQFKNIGNTDYDPNYTMYATYLLDADIASDGEPFSAIGTAENPFYGQFDGRVYTIDLTANPEIDTTADYYGLFGVVRDPNEGGEAETEPAEPTAEPKTEPTVESTEPVPVSTDVPLNDVTAPTEEGAADVEN